MNLKVDENKVRLEAKHILDKFAKVLEKVEKEEGKDSYIDREEFFREEKDGYISEKGFKERILENAPHKDDDFIIAEKGSWK
ncbi:MAG: hypothetical protein WC867_00170 [Candidatus Pacearchaeota archaeon]|jgi:predicted Asp-tRNA(Asn)/Glu-tRNA(Gln) amidotransferase subunit C